VGCSNCLLQQQQPPPQQQPQQPQQPQPQPQPQPQQQQQQQQKPIKKSIPQAPFLPAAVEQPSYSSKPPAASSDGHKSSGAAGAFAPKLPNLGFGQGKERR